MILAGWPERKSQVSKSILSYDIRDELTVQD